MIGIVVPETCWASNKICNKNHLLHLVGILFPHDDSSSPDLVLQPGQFTQGFLCFVCLKQTGVTFLLIIRWSF
jgi:hypothetical protein